ncbi:MAG TPA: zinc-binding dehydrogenase [Terriglobales bacterium]|nr:zinc-binding dehydrogenase [Terriglobales bacterium]
MMARTSRAAILARSHQPLIVDDIELPAHLDSGQVLVRLLYSGICGSQLGEIDAIKGPDKHLPHLLGHEGTGVVEEIGAGVSTVAVGDTVVLHWRKGSGIEAAPPRYRWRGEPLNAGWVTTFNELAVVSENRLTAIDADQDLRAAALLGCPVTTGLGTVLREAQLGPGESAVVIGAGGVGLSQILAAQLVSAARIVAVDRTETKLELARRLGATDVIASGDEVAAAIAAAVGEGGADAVFENTGVTTMIELAVRVTAPQGRCILVGVPQEADASLNTLPLHFGQRWIGSHGGSSEPAVDIPRYLRLARSGQLPLSQLVTDSCRLDEINDALDRLRRGEIAGRCLITFEKRG